MSLEIFRVCHSPKYVRAAVVLTAVSLRESILQGRAAAAGYALLRRSLAKKVKAPPRGRSTRQTVVENCVVFGYDVISREYKKKGPKYNHS